MNLYHSSGIDADNIENFAYVIYGSKDGQIRHIHQVSYLGDVRRESEYDMEEEAVKLAKERGCNMRGAKTLRLKDFAPEPDTEYEVDLKKLALRTKRKK